MKRWHVAVGIFGGLVGIVLSGAPVLAVRGIDSWQAYLKALEYGLAGLREYFSFIVELFKLVT